MELVFHAGEEARDGLPHGGKGLSLGLLRFIRVGLSVHQESRAGHKALHCSLEVAIDDVAHLLNLSEPHELRLEEEMGNLARELGVLRTLLHFIQQRGEEGHRGHDVLVEQREVMLLREVNGAEVRLSGKE